MALDPFMTPESTKPAPRKALVLSGGGMFGAWQAGAWSVLAKRFRPDLVVGASVGSLNGYAIASGYSPEELCALWTLPGVVSFGRLNQSIAALIRRPPKIEFAAVLTDALRMKPVTFTGVEITAASLRASCAIPPVVFPVRIGGNWYCDGGLLNPLPVFAAANLGATEILALHALPHLPGVVLPLLAKPFLALFGYRPPLPEHVRLITVKPPARLGTWREAIRWNRENSRRWIQDGIEAAEKNISALDCLGG
jgi:NTE family protein